MTQYISQGWEIVTQPKRVSSDAPTTVRMHKLGSPDTHWFTPDELLQFASKLMEAAHKVREEAA